ncbi:MAG: hypothetical protein ACK44W_18550, partial [Planctomycetota bacterium]
ENESFRERLIDLFRKPSAQKIARRDLEEARRQLLKAQSSAEYWRHMSHYYYELIKRLEREAQ